MKPEHERVIEAMAEAWCSSIADIGDDCHALESALRAAAKEGFVLAKLPDAKEESGHAASMGRMELYIEGAAEGWNECLDAIETITLEKEQDNG